MEIQPCVFLALSVRAACGRHLYVPLEPPRSWLSVTPSLQHSLTEISIPRPPAYSLNRTLNSLENFTRGPVRFCFMVRMRPGINNSLKAPGVIMLYSLNGTPQLFQISCGWNYLFKHWPAGKITALKVEAGGSLLQPVTLPLLLHTSSFLPIHFRVRRSRVGPKLLKVPGWRQLCCWGTIL